jgi:hypothetical protein
MIAVEIDHLDARVTFRTFDAAIADGYLAFLPPRSDPRGLREDNSPTIHRITSRFEDGADLSRCLGKSRSLICCKKIDCDILATDVGSRTESSGGASAPLSSFPNTESYWKRN